MSEVRRDNKGRKLFNGESQRKDGKYEYKYQDAWGKRKTVSVITQGQITTLWLM